MILHLSFAVRRGQRGRKGRKCNRRDEVILQSSVNDTTVRLAPEAPVKELGNVLPWLLDFMASVPAEKHIHFSKMDLANGYWRMVVEPAARWNFTYVMPGLAGEPSNWPSPAPSKWGGTRARHTFAPRRKRFEMWPKLG
jgi:hypothetical protein